MIYRLYTRYSERSQKRHEACLPGSVRSIPALKHSEALHSCPTPTQADHVRSGLLITEGVRRRVLQTDPVDWIKGSSTQTHCLSVGMDVTKILNMNLYKFAVLGHRKVRETRSYVGSIPYPKI